MELNNFIIFQPPDLSNNATPTNYHDSFMLTELSFTVLYEVRTYILYLVN